MRDIVQFFAYVSFFPQLVAGPIERATNLLPQFGSGASFDYDTAVDGLRQMLWGFFKKMVVADSCALYVDQIFAHPDWFNGATLLLAAVLFTIQIYGDFSGYSDIAIGCAKLFGIRLRRNFNVPYFSRDIAEFWRRWHISLTTWFRDYIYIPMGGSRVPEGQGGAQHLHHLPCQRPLARRQLDLRGLGRLPCPCSSCRSSCWAKPQIPPLAQLGRCCSPSSSPSWGGYCSALLFYI